MKKNIGIYRKGALHLEQFVINVTPSTNRESNDNIIYVSYILYHTGRISKNLNCSNNQSVT